VLLLVLVIEKPMKRNDHEQEHEHDYEREPKTHLSLHFSPLRLKMTARQRAGGNNL